MSNTVVWILVVIAASPIVAWLLREVIEWAKRHPRAKDGNDFRDAAESALRDGMDLLDDL